MKLYCFSPDTREFTGIDEFDESGPLLPDVGPTGFKTADPLPEYVKGTEVPQRNKDNSAWSVVKDYRGKRIFSTKASGMSIVVKDLGSIPEGYTLEDPVVSWAVWNSDTNTWDRDVDPKDTVGILYNGVRFDPSKEIYDVMWKAVVLSLIANNATNVVHWPDTKGVLRALTIVQAADICAILQGMEYNDLLNKYVKG